MLSGGSSLNDEPWLIRSCGVKANLIQLFPLVILVALMLTGCASKSAYVIARRDSQYTHASTDKIALANQNQAGPEEQELARALVAELERQGFRIVPQNDADYTLTVTIEDDWRTRKTIVRNVEPALGLGVPGPQTASGMPVAETPGIYHRHNTPYQYQTARVVDEQVPAQGIRLRLYSRASIRAGRLQTAWDGYIDGGPRVSPEQQPVLLRTLLAQFGRDFSGRVPLRLSGQK